MTVSKSLFFLCIFMFVSITGRSLNVKKNDAIKESTESNTLEDEDSKGNSEQIEFLFLYVSISCLLAITVHILVT